MSSSGPCGIAAAGEEGSKEVSVGFRAPNPSLPNQLILGDEEREMGLVVLGKWEGLVGILERESEGEEREGRWRRRRRGGETRDDAEKGIVVTCLVKFTLEN